MTAKPYQRERLSRDVLEQGLQSFVQVWQLNVEDDGVVEGWGDFIKTHGHELFALALVAINRLDATATNESEKPEPPPEPKPSLSLPCPSVEEGMASESIPPRAETESSIPAADPVPMLASEPPETVEKYSEGNQVASPVPITTDARGRNYPVPGTLAERILKLLAPVVELPYEQIARGIGNTNNLGSTLTTLLGKGLVKRTPGDRLVGSRWRIAPTAPRAEPVAPPVERAPTPPPAPAPAPKPNGFRESQRGFFPSKRQRAAAEEKPRKVLPPAPPWMSKPLKPPTSKGTQQ